MSGKCEVGGADEVANKKLDMQMRLDLERGIREVSGVRDGEALDVPLPGYLSDSLARYRRVVAADDTVLQEGRALHTKAEALRAAQATLVDEPQGTALIPEGTGPLRELDEVGDDNQLVRVTHYTCLEENYGGAHYCGYMGCPGAGYVRAGFAACPAWRCGQQFVMGGYTLVCGDTGSWPIEAGQVVDVACYSFEWWGWPKGTENYVEGYDELSCPAFQDWETVRWLTP